MESSVRYECYVADLDESSVYVTKYKVYPFGVQVERASIKVTGEAIWEALCPAIEEVS